MKCNTTSQPYYIPSSVTDYTYHSKKMVKSSSRIVSLVFDFLFHSVVRTIRLQEVGLVIASKSVPIDWISAAVDCSALLPHSQDFAIFPTTHKRLSWKDEKRQRTVLTELPRTSTGLKLFSHFLTCGGMRLVRTVALTREVWRLSMY